MGRWTYNWEIRYYRSWNSIQTVDVRAKTREDALKKFHEQVDKCIEVIWCKRTDTW